jgi:hypothetical protein
LAGLYEMVCSKLIIFFMKNKSKIVTGSLSQFIYFFNKICDGLAK